MKPHPRPQAPRYLRGSEECRGLALGRNGCAATRQPENGRCGGSGRNQFPHDVALGADGCRQRRAAIVNVSSGLAFVPFPISPIYSATKAGLHAFTQALRVQLRKTNIKVFELAPPGTETPLLRGDFDETDLGGVTGMDVTKLARLAIKGMQRDLLEIRPGLSNLLKLLSRISPALALTMLAKANAASLDRMQAQAEAKTVCTNDRGKSGDH
jgi:NAD(P)-dependent dehydrogenase (short-subunit alcohol dehydrogenase family)